MKPKKSWREKLADNKGLPRIGEFATKNSKNWGKGVGVIPAPVEVDALMKKIPKGKLATINELRSALATRHKVDYACPITTGIFAWIAAHAADEAEAEGKKTNYPLLANIENWRPGQRTLPRRY